MKAIRDVLAGVFDPPADRPARNCGGVLIWHGQRIVERYFLEPDARAVSLRQYIVGHYRRLWQQRDARCALQVIHYEFEEGYDFAHNCESLAGRVAFLRSEPAAQPAPSRPVVPGLPPGVRRSEPAPATRTPRGHARSDPVAAVESLRDLVRLAEADQRDGSTPPCLYLFGAFGISFLRNPRQDEGVNLLGFLHGLPERLYQLGHLMVLFVPSDELARELKSGLFADSPLVRLASAPEPDENMIFDRLLAEELTRKQPRAEVLACARQSAAFLQRWSSGRDRLCRSTFDNFHGQAFDRTFLKRYDVDDVESALAALDLEQLRGRLRAQIFNQDDALEEMLKELHTLQARIRNGRFRNRRQGPLFKKLLAGPSGTGKSHLARCLSRELFGREPCEILMENITNRTSLVGAPAGHVGFGGVHPALEKLHTAGSGVVLIDEWERAGSDATSRKAIHDCFMSVFEEGHLDTEDRRHISFREAIILVTTNLGMHEVDYEGHHPIQYDSEAQRRERYKQAITRPNALGNYIEFPWLGRLGGEPIVFRPFRVEDMRRLAEVEWAGLLAEHLGWHEFPTVEVAGSDLEQEYRGSHDPRLGAHNLKSLVARHFEELLEQTSIEGRVRAGVPVRLSRQKGKLAIL